MTRGVVRVLALLGVAFAAYLVLTLFDHAARADTGSADQPLGNPVKAATTHVEKAVPKPPKATPKAPAPRKKAVTKAPAPRKKAVVKAAVSKVRSQARHRPAVKASAVHLPKTPKVQALTGDTGRQVRATTTKLRQSTSGTVRATTTKLRQSTSGTVRAATTKLRQSTSGTVRATTTKLRQSTSGTVRAATTMLRESTSGTVTLVRTVVARQSLPPAVQLPLLPDLSGLPQTGLDVPTELPQALLRGWGSPLLSGPDNNGEPQPRTPRSTGVTALVDPLPRALAVTLAPGPSTATGLTTASGLATAPGLAAAPGLSTGAERPVARIRPPGAPLPVSPGLPADRSAPAGQARDSGGGSAPSMGTVVSAWRPEVTAAGRRLSTDLLARGRTVRYAGEPG